MRIQILELPSESVGEVYKTPWIAVISEPGEDVVGWSTELKAAGASAVLFTNNFVEIGPPPGVIEEQFVEQETPADSPWPELIKRWEEGRKSRRLTTKSDWYEPLSAIEPEYWRDSNLVELVAKARYYVAKAERGHMIKDWDEAIDAVKESWRASTLTVLGKKN